MKALLNEKTLALPIALCAAAVLALAFGNESDAPPGTMVEPAVAPPADTRDELTTGEGIDVVGGRVAEKIDASRYSYLKLTTDDGIEVWAAVPQADVPKGTWVTIQGAQLMEAFVSPTLGRTFDRIYFGTLAGDADALSPAAQDDSPDGDPHAAWTEGSSPQPDDATPHGMPGAAGVDLRIGSVARAAGPTGRSIAEIYAQRSALAGKLVRVRGVVVKAVPGVLERTFVHLRDGSGDAARGTHDLALTTAEQPEQGQMVLYQGKLTVDRDYGSGYRYPVVLEDANSLTE